jgi:hypothetical protein
VAPGAVGFHRPSEGTQTPSLPKLLSAPGIVALAVFGIMFLAASRVFGADAILRPVILEVVAGLGNTALILALFSCSSGLVLSACCAGRRAETSLRSP